MPENRKRDQIQWVSTGDPSTVDDSRLLYPGQLGGIFTDKNGGEWQYVQGDSTMSVAPFPGATLWWADRTNFKVTTSPTTLGRGRVAGVIPVFQQDGATRVASKSVGGYFFVQKGGVAKIKFVDAPTAQPTAAGLIVIPSATAGKADCLAAGSAATYPKIGASAGTYDAVNCEANVELSIEAETN
jgi:hypothetical protein